METPPEKSVAETNLTRFKVAKILASATVVSVLFARAAPVMLWATLLLAVATVLAVIITALTRLQFSLRTMLIVVLWTGGCATLLTKIEEPALFTIGIVGTLILIAFIISAVVRANIPKEHLDK